MTSRTRSRWTRRLPLALALLFVTASFVAVAPSASAHVTGTTHTCHFVQVPDDCPSHVSWGTTIRFHNDDPLVMRQATIQDLAGAVLHAVCLAPGATEAGFFTFPNSDTYLIIWDTGCIGIPAKATVVHNIHIHRGGPIYGCVWDGSGSSRCVGEPPWEVRNCVGTWTQNPGGGTDYTIVCVHERGAYVCEGHFDRGYYFEHCRGIREDGCIGDWYDHGEYWFDEKGKMHRKSFDQDQRC